MIVKQALHQRAGEGAVAGDPAAELLDRAVVYVLRNGLGDLSLRPLATALGTSARMLIYYFGSKEALIVEILDEVRRRKYVDLNAGDGEHGALRRYWEWARSAEGRRYLRLVYEIYGLSLRDAARFKGFLQSELQDVLDVFDAPLVAAGIPADEARALSTYTFAGIRGLELDMLGSGDYARVDRAFDMLEADAIERVNELIASRTPRKEKRR
jgi:AcrR family transcriptional regulator